MSVECCNHDCGQSDRCPLHSPMNEHYLTILKLKLAGVVLLLIALGLLHLLVEAA